MSALDDRLGHQGADLVRWVFRERKARRERDGESAEAAHEGARLDACWWAQALGSGFLEIVEVVPVSGSNHPVMVEGGAHEQMRMV